MSDEIRMPVFVPPEGAPKVNAAIVGVMHKIRDIPKTGYNKEHSYRFVEATVLTAKVQDAMVEFKLVLPPREVSRAVVSGILFMKFEFDAYCEDQAILNISSYSGSCRFQFRNGSCDDKASAKCLTSAMKQMEIALFKIPADVEDIERDRPDYIPPGDPATKPKSDKSDDDRRGFDEDQAAPDAHAPPPGEPVTSGDVKAFRSALTAVYTRDEADRIWLAHASLLDRASDEIYRLLADDYRHRWDIAPPALPETETRR